jgi:3-hydroxyisobutyrate dehydrogenase-like beta-hydroxyacid dehydrogenase
MSKIGFIGLGSQGAPMARRILDAGFPLMLWARRPQALEAFTGTGAEFAASIADLAAQVEHVGICVVDDAGVEQVVAQLLRSMQSGSRIAIHSTVQPDLCRELARKARQKNIQLIDAPVSGGGVGAAAGALTVMVGGEATAVSAATPIFKTFATQIVHLGGVGAGQTAKLVNNALMAANLALAHHALEMSDVLGIDRPALIELIKASSGRSFGFEVRARMTTPAAFRHGASLLAKDVCLLGASMEDNADFLPLRDAAMPFLDLALKSAP